MSLKFPSSSIVLILLTIKKLSSNKHSIKYILYSINYKYWLIIIFLYKNIKDAIICTAVKKFYLQFSNGSKKILTLAKDFNFYLIPLKIQLKCLKNANICQIIIKYSKTIENISLVVSNKTICYLSKEKYKTFFVSILIVCSSKS